MSKSCLKSAGNNAVTSHPRPALLRNKLCVAILLAIAGPAYALPQGGQVVAGDVAIAVSGDTMDIQQNSQRAILDFHSFDIADQQTVNFQQPGADAVALNRVLGDRLSEIHGALNANGQIYLINPNGVLFGNGAEINVGSLVVTTLDIADQDFLAGRDAFSGSADGRVENRGRIDADGRVVLLAPEVINSGEINVPDGDIVLQSSRQALLHTPGSDIPILVEDTDLIGRVANEGTLSAGEVALILHSDKAQLAYDAAINNSGLVRAVRASGEGGEIHLLSGAGILNSGTLDASADTGAGGEITLTAEAINQSGQITAKAAGTGDGGTITLLADNAIAMHSGSTIDASADQVGDAGDVVVIAEKATWFTGDASIKARGGEQSGDGGFVEVSGLEFISIDGAVNVGADNGNSGLWFIDPTDIEINPGNNVGGGFNNSDPNTWTAQPGTSTAGISLATLFNTIDNDGNVKIVTTSNGTGTGTITFNTVLDINNLGTQNAGRVNTLELVADDQIIFTANGGIWDSAPGGDGVNLNFTAEKGFIVEHVGAQPDGRGVVNSGLGKLNINVLDGDALITGLASGAAAEDAIRVTVNNGKIIENGDSLWDARTLHTDGGVILSARDGIEGLSLDVNYIQAVSSAGGIDLYAGGENINPASIVVVNQLSAATTAVVDSPRQLWMGASVQGTHVELSSDNIIVLPESGFTASDALTLSAPDIVAYNTDGFGDRTLSVNATELTIDTNAAGGNLVFLSDIDRINITNTSSSTITVNNVDELTLGTVIPQVGNLVINTGAGADLEVGETLNLSNAAGSLTLGAGRDLLINADIVDTDGSGITFLQAINGSVIFGATSQVNAGAGDVEIVAGGNVALGSVTGGTVTIEAGAAITDANGSDVNISATDAVLFAGTSIGSLTDSLEASVTTLDLTTTNGGAFLSNSQSLNLIGLDITGDLNIHLPTGDLTLSESNPTITGNATFSVANGQLIVPAIGGWNTTGNLTVNATRIVDSNSSATVSLTANNADLTLTGAVASTLNVDFNTLALQLSGGSTQAVQVTDSNALSISNLSSNGNLTISTANGSDLTITDTTPVSSGQLTLNVGRNLVLSTAGLNVTGNLIISADDMRDSNASSNVSLGAANADITLRNATGARSWSTSFNQLVLNIAGTGNFELTDTDGLTLTSVDTGGSASFTTTGADLVLTTQLQVAGDLALRTTGAGNVVVPDARFAHVGNLVIDANDLLDTNRTLSLEATSADIRLRNPGGNHTWTTQLGSLALEMGGTADIQLTDEDGLTLTGLSVGGNATIGTTGADLVLLTAPDVDGVLSLTTTTSGDLVIDDDGLMHGGGLIIVARNIRNSDDSTITLGATNADITLRDGGQAQTWNTSFTQLALQIAGAGDFDLTDTDGLTLTAVSTGGNASFRTTGADLVLNSTPNVDGALTLATVGPGDVVIPNGGLQHTDELTITADNLRGSDADLSLSATTANITLRNGGAQARTWTTDFDELVLAITSTGDLNLTNANALNLTSITTGGDASIATQSGGLTLGTGIIGGNAAFTAADGDLEFINAPTFSGDLSLTANSGAVIVDDAGLIVSGDLTIDAEDLRDSDADVTLTADTANITLRNGGAQARDWATTFDELVLDITGTGDFELTNAGALILTSVNTDGNASFTTSNGNLSLGAGSIDGNAAFTATAGNVVMISAPTVTGDLSLTTVGTGDVIVSDGLSVGGDLTVDAGDLRDIDGGDLTLVADNANITLRDTGAQARAWTTTFDELALNIAGTGDFSLTNTDTLILSSITTGGNTSIATLSGGLTLGPGSIGGNAAFTAADGDLEFINAPTFSGDLSLTANSGAVIVDDAGLIVSGDLTIDAEDLRDSDADVTLTADTANITLRNGGAQARDWATTFDELVLDITGTGDFELTNAGALILASVNTDGNASFTTSSGDLTLSAGSIDGNAAFSAAGDLVMTSAPTITGDLSLTTGNGDVIVSDGLSVGGDLTVDADDLRDIDGGDLTLVADNANITLRDTGAQARAWTTTFDELALNIAGTGDFSLTNTDTLILSSITTGGNASIATLSGGLTLGTGSIGGNAAFTAADGDLEFTNAPTFSGDLSLTASSGAVIVDDAGLIVTGDLTIDARDLRDSNADLTLEAATANITLSAAGSQARTWTTTFDELVLDITGTGDFELTNTGDLTLTSVTTGGNASFSSTNADLVVTSEPVVGGALSLIAEGSGDLILPTAGLTHSGDLVLTADRVMAGDGDVRLAAARLSATLRDQQQAANWLTSTNRFDLNLTGGGAFNLTNTGALRVDSLVSDGLVNVATEGDLQIGSVTGTTDMAFSGADIALLESDYSIDGELSLSAANQLQLAAAGLTVPEALRLHASTLNAAGGGPVILAADTADLTLTGNQALALMTRLSQLGLTYHADTLSINNDRDLALTRWDAANLAHLSLTASGTLTIPAAGLAASQRLNIDAVDLLDGDRSLTLSAPELAVRLSNAGGDHDWTVDADVLDVLLRGQANLSVLAADGLRLADLNGDANAVMVENGNFSLVLSSGDLILAGDVSAADLSADGERSGMIDLLVEEGSVRTSGPVVVSSINTLDQTAGTEGDAYGIRIRLTDTGATERSIVLGDETGAATLRAIGGDVLLDTRPASTAAGAVRKLVQRFDSVIEVYNNPGDAPTGQVLLNGEPVTAQAWQTVRENRLLAIVSDVAAQDPGTILDELDDFDDHTNIVQEPDSSGPLAADQFVQVFGTCDELDQKNQHRCRVDAALKSFLSHWLVGGEMPPKSEIR